MLAYTGDIRTLATCGMDGNEEWGRDMDGGEPGCGREEGSGSRGRFTYVMRIGREGCVQHGEGFSFRFIRSCLQTCGLDVEWNSGTNLTSESSCQLSGKNLPQSLS